MDQQTLAAKLRVLRARQGWTLGEAVDRMGIQLHTLRDLELGRRKPHYSTLNKIAEGYGAPVEELLGKPYPSAAARSTTEGGKRGTLSRERALAGP